jgi:dihydrofolate synthase/folylpolyglutamate synthase
MKGMSAPTYAAAIDHLYALGHELATPPPNADGTPAPRRKFDLDYMRILVHALGDPQLQWPSVLIAGTNGKGSTAATLGSILTAAGYRTGLYTSPHLIRVNERIQISGLQIDDEDFARIYFHVDDTAIRLVTSGELPHHPSFFEVVTAVAFTYFAEQKIDIAVLEVGLGGRLDATNIVEPLISILTDIALDHQDYLGDTITAIAREKAGILRPNGLLVTLPQHPEANQAIGEAAATLDLKAFNAADLIPHTPSRPASSISIESSSRPEAQPERRGPRISPEAQQHPQEALRPNHYTLTLENEPLEVDSPLSGEHQRRNLALAITAASVLRNLSSYKSTTRNQISYKISNTAIEEGIRNTNWPGRLELLHFEASPDLLLDVAHNPAGAWTLRAALAQLPEDRPRTLLFSCLRDKNLEEMSRILFPLFDASADADPDRRHDHIVFAPIDNPRAASVEDLLAAAHKLSIPAHAAPHMAAALAQAQAITPPDGLIIATGSVYLIGEIRQLAQTEGGTHA